MSLCIFRHAHIHDSRPRSRAATHRLVRTVGVGLVLALTVTLVTLAGSRTPTAASEQGENAAPARSGAIQLGDGRRRVCAVSTRGIPRCGMFVGASVGLNAIPKPFERQVGRLGVHRSFYQASQVDRALRTVRRDLRAGRVPWISFKLPYGWAEMADGQGNAWAAGIARRLARVDGPVWVAFHHEPELDGDIRLWTRTQEQLAPVVRRLAPNVAYSIILMGWHQFYGEAQYSLGSLWPRTKVDILGLDLYNYYGVAERGGNDPPNMKEMYFRKAARWARRHDVAWGLSELGWTDTMSRRNPRWLARTYRDLRRTGAIAGSYFNSHPSNAVADWRLDTALRRRGYARVLDRSLHLRR
jgi:hypothetical protein